MEELTGWLGPVGLGSVGDKAPATGLVVFFEREDFLGESIAVRAGH